jgi:DNA-binding XRE family transcriptional regulator
MRKTNLNKSLKQSNKWHAEIKKKVMNDPIAREAYERTTKEIEIVLMLRKKRELANISQEVLAKKINTTRSAISRLESSGLGRHSPSLDTILKYANALGYTMKLTLVPLKSKSTNR